MEDNEENLLEENGKILSFANYADGDYLIVERSHMETVMVKLKQISFMQNLSNYLGNV